MAQKSRVLVVDDEKDMLDLLQIRLEHNNFEVDTAISGEDALELISNEKYSAVLADIQMPKMDGLELMVKVREIDENIPIIFLTAHGNIKTAVESMKGGAFYFLEKPFDSPKILEQLRRATDPYRDKKAASINKAPDSSNCFSNIIANSKVMHSLLERAKNVLEYDSTVLIHGQSGTGKELLAQALHKGGGRSKNKFVVIDCGATHASLLESELFGHVKGAFTNADRDKEGLFEQADGGTIFLDEIASISNEMQKKLLRVIQEGEIRKVGSAQYKKVDVRIISATNRNLLEAVKKGSFREDLYYRLKVIYFDIPSLFQRREDIPIFAEHFLKEFTQKMGKEYITGFEKGVMEKMAAYPWPGNIRELKNMVESSVAISRNENISEEDIEGSDILNTHGSESFVLPVSEKHSIDLKENEKELIVSALKKSDWVQKKAAELLGISSRVINYKVQKLNIRCKDRTY